LIGHYIFAWLSLILEIWELTTGSPIIAVTFAAVRLIHVEDLGEGCVHPGRKPFSQSENSNTLTTHITRVVGQIW
jgi:hypothetical protein